MLNKQGPGKIDWTDYTWNPITGCNHGCDYCYMRRVSDKFNYDMTPRYHPKRLEDVEALKTPSKIFVSSSGDLFGDWVPEEWIHAVLKVALIHPQHTFQFLTKNPKRYLDFCFTPNCWLGTTMDGTSRTSGNVASLGAKEGDNIKFCSLEPLLHHVDFYDRAFYHDYQFAIGLCDMDWLIIGADSNKGVKKPPDAWADYLISCAKAQNIPVWVKDNYKYRLRIKQFPREKKRGSCMSKTIKEILQMMPVVVIVLLISLIFLSGCSSLTYKAGADTFKYTRLGTVNINGLHVTKNDKGIIDVSINDSKGSSGDLMKTLVNVSEVAAKAVK